MANDLGFLCDHCGEINRNPSRQRGQYCCPACRRNDQTLRILTHRYRITIDDYRRMFPEQAHRCAICKLDLGSVRAVEIVAFIDHDHRTGHVRGLLCRKCNWLLARVGDDADLLSNAAKYLRRAR